MKGRSWNDRVRVRTRQVAAKLHSTGEHAGYVVAVAIRTGRRMSSLTDLKLWFHFRADTPAEVLSAFQPLYRPDPDSEIDPPPSLRPFESTAGDEWWIPDWKEAGYDSDPLANEPWRHAWASWISESLTVPSGAALVWSRWERLWHLSCQCSIQVWPDAILDFLQWLGPFIKTTDNDAYPRPDLVGVMTYGSSLRPYLLFCEQQRLFIQNLNGPHDEF